jgi:polyisoprenyl-phosphate glycosyltransferase
MINMERPESSAQTPVYSIVAPIFDEAKSLDEFYERVRKTMDALGESWELVLINDGSRDNSLEKMREIHEKDPRVHLIDFARNFGHQIAVSAGMDYARGDAVVIIDSDLQDPPEVIARLAEQWKNGYEVVYGLRCAQQARRRDVV